MLNAYLSAMKSAPKGAIEDALGLAGLCVAVLGGLMLA